MFSYHIFLPCRIRFIHFHFQLVEKFEHVQTFQLIEINLRFVENVKFLAITLHSLLISRNRIQLNGYCNASFTAILSCVPCCSSNWWKHSSNLSFYWMSNKVNIMPECCFDVTLVDFEQIRMISYNQVLND